MTIGTSSVSEEYFFKATSKSALSLLPAKYPNIGSFSTLKSVTEMSDFGTTDEMHRRPSLQKKTWLKIVGITTAEIVVWQVTPPQNVNPQCHAAYSDSLNSNDSWNRCFNFTNNVFAVYRVGICCDGVN
jgi:hypothetical protein